MVLPRRDWAPVNRRLITMRRAVEKLEEIGPLEPAVLESNPPLGLVVERVLWLLADQVGGINTLVTTSLTGLVPRTAAESFDAVVEAGMIDGELTPILAPAEGPNNVLMQLCLDTAPEEVASVVSAALSGYKKYIEQVTRWISDATNT